MFQIPSTVSFFKEFLLSCPSTPNNDIQFTLTCLFVTNLKCVFVYCGSPAFYQFNNSTGQVLVTLLYYFFKVNSLLLFILYIYENIGTVKGSKF
jgi:hypothetical protein